MPSPLELITEARRAQSAETPAAPLQRLSNQRWRVRGTPIGETEADFFNWRESQQAIRDRELQEMLSPVGLAGMGIGAATGFGSQVLGSPGDIRSLYEEFKPESFPSAPQFLKDFPTTEEIQEALGSKTGTPEYRTGVDVGNLIAIGQGVKAIPKLVKSGAQAAGSLGKMVGKEINEAMLSGQGPFGQLLAPIAPRRLDVYHGGSKFAPTPENPLGAFDPSKIGTGEGLQFGYGTYLTEAPDVGRGYVTRDMDYEAKLYKLYQQAEKRNDPFSMEILERAMMHKTPSELRTMYPPQAAGLISQIEKIPHAGALYKANLPDELIPRMLDLDKPFMEQPHVIKALEAEGVSKDALNQIAQNIGTSGDALYQYMARRLGGQKQASDYMRRIGIPGNVYLDPSQRDVGLNVRNFVVFPGEEKAVRIKQKLKNGGEVGMDAMRMSVWGKPDHKVRGGKMIGEIVDPALKTVKEVREIRKRAKPGQTVSYPERMAFPGIYQRPDVIAAEAASRVADEDPALKRLFGVTREDLYQIGKGRKGNLPGDLPGQASKPRGSEAASNVMTRSNVKRILDVNAEAEKHPQLVQGMDPWYVMDPVYRRMVELIGPEQAKIEYRKFNTLMGMASPGSEVLTEIPRGTAAYFLHKQGRFPEFIEHLGKPEAARSDVASDIVNVPGHAYHSTSQATPMQRYLEAGEVQMKAPKVPMYIQASQVPEIGFQTRTPVGDAHWSRAIGLADTRGARTIKGKEVIPGASVSNPEMTQLAPWWRDEIAAQLGIESVPAQARTWGAFSGQTGVTTPIGAPKLELLAQKIMETANRLGVSPETARDMVLMGEAYAGKKKGGKVVKKADGGMTSDDLIVEERKL